MPQTPPLSNNPGLPTTPHPSSNHQSHVAKSTHPYARIVPSHSINKDYLEPPSRRLHPPSQISANNKMGGGGGGLKDGMVAGVLGVDAVLSKSKEHGLKGKVERTPLGDAVSAQSNSNTSSPSDVTSVKGGSGESKSIQAQSQIKTSKQENRISKPLPPHPKDIEREDIVRVDIGPHSRGHAVSTSVSTIVPPKSQAPITPPNQVLSRPKSKLRLRLKLTPPHPPGTKVMSVPTEPVPIRPKAFGGPSPPKHILKAASVGADDEIVAGKQYHYLKQQPSISTLNEHAFTRTSDIAASEADARTAKAIQQASALSRVAGNPSIQARAVSGPARGTHANRPPPPAASQKRREMTVVKRMLSADGLRGRAMEMGRSLLSGNSSRENLLSVPIAGSNGKVERPAVTGESVHGQENVVDIGLSGSECSWNLFGSTKEESPKSAFPPSFLNESVANKPSESRGKSITSASASGSNTPSYMDLSMTMSNPSQSSVNQVISDAEELDENLLHLSTDPSQSGNNSSSETKTAVDSSEDPSTPRRVRVVRRHDSFTSQVPADEETFNPASDSTPVKSGRSANRTAELATTPSGDSSMWTDSSMQQSRLQKSQTSVTKLQSNNSSPFKYDNGDQSLTTSQEDAANTSGVTLTTASTDPSPTRQKGDNNKGEGEVATDIFSLTDQMLSDRYKFVEEIGFGNWGSVWVCKPRQAQYHPLHRLAQQPLPAMSPGRIIAAQHHHSRIAVKLVHRAKTPTTAARVRALWSEMKVIRTLRADPHPSVVAFDSFIITPSYALIVMPYYAQLIPVNIAEDRARSYFKQLASALAYLHDKGITHNDLKPSNILLSHADVPVLVDFGFATKWDLAEIDLTSCGDLSSNRSPSKKESFFSEISWGTPEYLDPPRARGIRHDERLSDVWSLGVTFFEVLSGRTPFEISEEEEFSTPEQLKVYYERTLTGHWIGDWKMSKPMESLLKGMIQPNHAKRLTALQSYHHYALSPAPSPAITTPPFVRSAASMSHMSSKDANRNKIKKEKKAKERVDPQPQAASSSDDKALVQSITETVAGPVLESSVQNKPTIRRVEAVSKPSPPKEKQYPEGIKSSTSPLQDITSFRLNTEDTALPRERMPVSVSADQMAVAGPAKEANITVRRHYHRKPSEHVPEYDQVVSEIAVQFTKEPEGKLEHSTASTIVRMKSIAELKRVTSREVVLGKMEVNASQPVSAADAPFVSEIRRASEIEATVRKLPGDRASNVLCDKAVNVSNPKLAELREKIMNNDQTNAVRYRTTSGNLTRPITGVTATDASEPDTRPTSAVAGLQDPTVSALDSRLDRIASWVKNVERIVEDARLTLNDVKQEQNAIPCSAFEVPAMKPANFEHDGFALEAKATHLHLTEHSRNISALSTKVEPATPPRWKSFERDFVPGSSAPSGHFKATHLKRQRSDLTGIRSTAFTSVVEEPVRPRPQTPLILGAISQEPLASHSQENKQDRKLRSHRSLGDIARLVRRSEDPYDRLLAERDGVLRHGEGYTGVLGSRAEAGFVRLASAPYKPKHGMFGLFHRKEAQTVAVASVPASSSRFKGLVHSMKTAFGRL